MYQKLMENSLQQGWENFQAELVSQALLCFQHLEQKYFTFC